MELIPLIAKHLDLFILPNETHIRHPPPTYNLLLKNGGCSLEEIEDLLLQDESNLLVYTILPSSHEISLTSSIKTLATRVFGNTHHVILTSSKLFLTNTSLQTLAKNVKQSLEDLPNQFYRAASSYPIQNNYVDRGTPEDHHCMQFLDKPSDSLTPSLELIVSSVPFTTKTLSYTYIFTDDLYITCKRSLSSIISSIRQLETLSIIIVEDGDAQDLSTLLFNSYLSFSLLSKANYEKEKDLLANKLVLDAQIEVTNFKMFLALLRKLPPLSSFQTCVFDLHTLVNCDEVVSEVFVKVPQHVSKAYIVTSPTISKHDTHLSPFFPCFAHPQNREEEEQIVKVTYYTSELLDRELGESIMTYSCISKGFQLYVQPSAASANNVLHETFQNISMRPLIRTFENPCVASIMPTWVPLIWQNGVYFEAEKLLRKIRKEHNAEIVCGIHVREPQQASSRYCDTSCSYYEEAVGKCKELFPSKRIVFVSNSSLIPDTILLENISKSVELCLFAHCDVFVCSISSFSWIAATQGKKKTVISPHKWTSSKEFEKRCIQESWILLE